jgi:hypothetical protein
MSALQTAMDFFFLILLPLALRGEYEETRGRAFLVSNRRLTWEKIGMKDTKSGTQLKLLKERDD